LPGASKFLKNNFLFAAFAYGSATNASHYLIEPGTFLKTFFKNKFTFTAIVAP